MATLTTSYDAPAGASRLPQLRRMLSGATVFDAAGGVFCLAVAADLARWLSIPRASAYVTGALFLGAAAAGALTLRRDPTRVALIVAANEVFALWCLLVLALDSPNALGTAMLAVATASSAGTGAAEAYLGRAVNAR